MKTFKEYKKSVLKQYHLMQEVDKICTLEKNLSAEKLQSLEHLEVLEAKKTELREKKNDLLFELCKLSEHQDIYVSKKKLQIKRRQIKYEQYEDSIASRTRNNKSHRKMNTMLCVHFKRLHFTSIQALL